jgi:hypothetical protein
MRWFRGENGGLRKGREGADRLITYTHVLGPRRRFRYALLAKEGSWTKVHSQVKYSTPPPTAHTMHCIPLFSDLRRRHRYISFDSVESDQGLPFQLFKLIDNESVRGIGLTPGRSYILSQEMTRETMVDPQHGMNCNKNCW